MLFRLIASDAATTFLPGWRSSQAASDSLRCCDTPAARDLVEQLPLTLSMRDHGGVEKNGSLRTSLSVADDPVGADPEVADLGYYAPANDLVLYYGDQSYYDGIVILGRLEGNVGALAEMADDLAVNVRLLAP